MLEVARLVSLGAQRVDVGQGDVGWVVLADPEGNEFCVLEQSTGGLAAVQFRGIEADAGPVRRNWPRIGSNRQGWWWPLVAVGRRRMPAAHSARTTVRESTASAPSAIAQSRSSSVTS